MNEKLPIELQSKLSLLDNNNNNRKKLFLYQHGDNNKSELLSIAAGVAAFGSTLCLSTWTQGRLLGISTGTPGPTPTLIGLASVCAASWVSHQAAIWCEQSCRRQERYLSFAAWREQSRAANANVAYDRWDSLDLKYVKIPWHTLRICTIGLVAFKLLGGRFWAIAPSSYTHVGSFARASLPATENYASPLQRAKLERLGRLWGCHTCGSRRLFNSWKRNSSLSSAAAARFVGDHMPPKAVAEQMNKRWSRRLLRRRPVPFRFYPQCVSCSNKQGSILSKATRELRARSSSNTKNLFARRRAVPQLHKAGGGADAYLHGTTFRINHLAGGVVGGIAVVGATSQDLRNENRWRYARFHNQLKQEVQDKWRRTAGYIEDQTANARRLWQDWA